MNRNLYSQGFVRVGAYSPRIYLGQPKKNAEQVISVSKKASDEGVGLAVFPQLCLTGTSLGDLFTSNSMLSAVLDALEQIIEASRELLPVIVVGGPMAIGAKTYNCSFVVHRGSLIGVVPKRFLNAEEKRWFSVGEGLELFTEIFDEAVAVGSNFNVQAVDLPDFTISFSLDAPGVGADAASAVLSGATVLVWPSGAPAVADSFSRRRTAIAAESARLSSAIVSAAPGLGESTSESAWSGGCLIAENGEVLAAKSGAKENAVTADVDLDLLVATRRANDFAGRERAEMASRQIELGAPSGDLGLQRSVPRQPFFPAGDESYAEIFELQASALETRLSAIGGSKVVLGVSGGLDSTHALLVAAETMDRAKRGRDEILTFTLPGFATTSHTKSNAQRLAEALGASFETIDIRPTAELILKNIGHPLDEYDVTFENVQAGVRTDYLFRIANQRGGIVLGTGDLSELALGWCTYGVGDQMSHYDINAGLPKTLMQQLVRWVIKTDRFGAKVSRVLQSILDTEITPELIPTAGDAKPQSTEGSIGPYNLHDFFLYWMLLGYEPTKIQFLALHAWADASKGQWPGGFPESSKVEYSADEINRWLKVFLRRFTTQQFKRTASPSGPALLGGGSLSPRNGWVAPSDANAEVFLENLD